METIHSFETSVLTRATRRNIPEDAILQSLIFSDTSTVQLEILPPQLDEIDPSSFGLEKGTEFMPKYRTKKSSQEGPSGMTRDSCAEDAQL
jgi:hypothetical protein